MTVLRQELQSTATAPVDRDLELAVIDASGEYTRSFFHAAA
jgi:hypothetical protein